MVYLIQCDFCQGLWLQSCWTQLQFLCQLCPVVQINHQVPFELSWTFKIPKLESHIHLQKKQGEKPLTSPVLKPSMIFNNDMSGKETVYPLTVKYPEGLSLWIWKKIQQGSRQELMHTISKVYHNPLIFFSGGMITLVFFHLSFEKIIKMKMMAWNSLLVTKNSLLLFQGVYFSFYPSRMVFVF